MNCEQRRNKSASPQSPCHLSHHEKQEDDSDGEQKIDDEVIPGRLQSVQLTIQHVRNDCQRVPISTNSVCECPPYVLQRKAPRYFRIIVNIEFVVVVDEIVCKRLTENQPGDHGENSTYPEDYSAFWNHCPDRGVFCHS